MKPEWNKFWEKLLSVAEVNCKQENDILTHLLRNLNFFFRVLLLPSGLRLPFQKYTGDTVRRFIFVSANNIYKNRDSLVTRGTVRPGVLSFLSALAQWSVDDNLSIQHILT